MKKFLILIPILFSYPSFGAATFEELCVKGPDGFPVNQDIVNCWGFESESEIYYNLTGGRTCPGWDDSFLSNHINGQHNPQPQANATVNTDTCKYPKIDNTKSSSGSGSIKIVQFDDPGGNTNSGGTFGPMMKLYRGSDGNWKFAAFGKGGEFWVHWRFRQNAGLFNYGAKRFMVTHKYSDFEIVLNATGIENGRKQYATPPFKYVEVYGHKGTESIQSLDPIGDQNVSNAIFYEADKWHTIEMHVKLADNGSLNNGLVELYFDGVKTHSDSTVNMGGLDLLLSYKEDMDWNSQQEEYAFFRLDFLLFENGKYQRSPPRPEGNMWIDDVVVSRVRMTDLVPGNTVRPNAPENLSTNSQ